MHKTAWFIAAATLVITAAACSSSSSSSASANGSSSATSTSASMSAPPMPAPAAVEVKTATAPGFGTYLTDQQGMTLYVFLLDEPGSPACTGDCLATWTPVIVQGKPKAGPGVDPKALSTEKVDGVEQLTIGGQPAYTYTGDSSSGQTNGQGIDGLWYTVAPDGSRITGITASPSM